MPKVPKVALVIEKSRAFGRGLLHGIAQYANLHGPWLFYTEPEGDTRRRERPHKWLTDLDADGIIGYSWDAGLIRTIVDLGVPAVIRGIDTPTAHAFRMVTDQEAVSRMAAEHFFERGFKRFAYCGYDDMTWSQRRGQSFGAIIEEAGHRCFFYRQPRAKRLRTPAREQAVIAEWLRALPKPVALMASNDDRSQDVLAACKIAGLDVPTEVAILGVDNDELVCSLSYPQLSSIALGTEGAGYEAARLLDKLMTGQPTTATEKEVLVSPLHVVPRQSTDITALEDPQVAAAIHFIRRHFKELILVDEVAEAVDLSRRTLEQRFRKLLHHSVHEEIVRTRVNQMARMLTDTNLPISQIARLLGYSYMNNISRYFRQQQGLSPSAYRKHLGPRRLLP
jgi:LacI family transcriptional regulator